MKTHGMFGTKLYMSWSAMLYRCRNPKAKAFPNYGGRGITVCDRWLNFSNFMLDMGDGHWDGAEIDRIDNNGNYEPGNCRWVTCAVNVRNKRNSLWVEFRGERRKLAELCAEIGVSRRHVNSRLAIGWDVDRALLEPVAGRQRLTVLLDGKRQYLTTVCANHGVSYGAVAGRLRRGWSIEVALSTPPDTSNAKGAHRAKSACN